MLSGVKTGSSKISHLRIAITAADEMLFWQTVLLRHFVPFTHQLAVPWDNGRAAGSLQHWNQAEEAQPSAWRFWNPTTTTTRSCCCRRCPWLHQKTPHMDAGLWKCGTKTRGTSTISHPQLVLRHTLRGNWALTHADAWTAAALHKKTD